MTSGNPAATSTTVPHAAATAWLSRPCASRKLRASAFSGTMPQPTSFDTSTTGPSAAARLATSCAVAALDVVAAQHPVGKPQRQAVDEDDAARAGPRPHDLGEIVGRVQRPPRGVARGDVGGDPRAHLAVPGLGGGDEDALAPLARRAGLDGGLRERALAGAGTADHQDVLVAAVHIHLRFCLAHRL